LGASDGTRAVVGQAVADLRHDVEQLQAAGDQLELIGLPANLSDEAATRARESARARGRGRPPGATNKATDDVKAFCRRVFGFDPLIEGFRWAQHSPESLAIALNCTRLEAFDRLETLRRDLCRYFHAPVQPVDAAGQAVPMFVMQVGGPVTVGAGAGAAPGVPPWLADPRRAATIEQNQGVTETEPAKSHGAVSHDEAK
jgi:hypothetical protein